MTLYQKLLIIALSPTILLAQNLKKIDSLKKKLVVESAETQYKLMTDMAWEFRFAYPDSTLYYASRAFNQANKLHLHVDLARALNYQGVAYIFKRDKLKAYELFSKALQLSTNLSDSIQMGHSYNNLGRLLYEQGLLAKAYDYYTRSYAIFKKLGDDHGLAYTLQSFGTLLKTQRDFAQAEKNYVDAYKIRLKTGNKLDIATALMWIGWLYYDKGEFKKSNVTLKQADSVCRHLKDELLSAQLGLLMAKNFVELGQLDEAEKLASEHAAVIKRLNYVPFMSETMYTLGNIKFLRNQLHDAKSYFMSSLKIASEAKDLHHQLDAYKKLWKLAEAEHNSQEAQRYMNQYLAGADSIKDLDLTREIQRFQFELEIEKKEKENELLKITQLKQEAELSVQRYAIVMIGIILMAVSVLLFVVYRSRQLFKKTNSLLKQKNYAIQTQRQEILSQKEKITSQMGELKRTQSQLIQSEKMASLGQMTSGIAHEINNPLNFISGGVEGLTYSIKELVHLAKNPDQLRKNNLEEIEEEANGLIGNISNGVFRATRIITSLRTFASPQGSSFVTVNIVDSIEMAITMLNNKIIENNIEVFRNYSDQTRPVKGNTSELTQVFSNIIDNAVQAMEGSMEPKELHVTTATTNDLVSITIKDTGRGIPQNIQHKILEPFFTTKAVGKGTGLGLSISYNIIERHAGKLTFESEEGKGATFTITLKQAKVKDEVHA